jgi:hypothetical protein
MRTQASRVTPHDVLTELAMRFPAGPMLKRPSHGFGTLTSRATGNNAFRLIASSGHHQALETLLINKALQVISLHVRAGFFVTSRHLHQRIGPLVLSDNRQMTHLRYRHCVGQAGDKNPS